MRNESTAKAQGRREEGGCRTPAPNLLIVTKAVGGVCRRRYSRVSRRVICVHRNYRQARSIAVVSSKVHVRRRDEERRGFK